MVERADYERCLHCLFWLPNVGEEEPYGDFACGECHRYPPSVPLIAVRGEFYEVTEQGSTSDSTLMGWPETYADAWCGEWRPDSEALGELSGVVMMGENACSPTVWSAVNERRWHERRIPRDGASRRVCGAEQLQGRPRGRGGRA